MSDTPAGSARIPWANLLVALVFVAASARLYFMIDRYAVNVLFLDPGADSGTFDEAGYIFDVFVLSAGPDEEVDTPFSIDGVAPGDDDIIRVVSGGSR